MYFISDKDKVVRLERKPVAVRINNKTIGNGKKMVQTEVLVPAMGMASLVADF